MNGTSSICSSWHASTQCLERISIALRCTRTPPGIAVAPPRPLPPPPPPPPLGHGASQHAPEARLRDVRVAVRAVLAVAAPAIGAGGLAARLGGLRVPEGGAGAAFGVLGAVRNPLKSSEGGDVSAAAARNIGAARCRSQANAPDSICRSPTAAGSYRRHYGWVVRRETCGRGPAPGAWRARL